MAGPNAPSGTIRPLTRQDLSEYFLSTFTREAAVQELEREIAMREVVFSKWIATGRITRKVAEMRLGALLAAKRLLEAGQ